MKKIVEDRGYFWWREQPVPDDCYAPDDCVTGVFSIDENGSAHLELDAYMPNNGSRTPAVLSGQQDARSIQGILKEGNRRVLLLDAVSNGGTFNTGGISYDRFSATNCLVGSAEFPRRKRSLQFNSLAVDLIGYEEWLRLGSIYISRTKSKIVAKHSKPKDHSYRLSDATLAVRHFISGPYLGKHRRHDLSLRESVTLKFRPKQSMSLEQVRSELHYLQDLFVLLTDTHHLLDWPTVSLSGSKEQYTLYFLRGAHSSEPPSWQDCPTNFVLLRATFGEIFATWRAKRERFGAGFYSYLGTRRGMALYAENRFANLVWGLEAFHRTKQSDAKASATSAGQPTVAKAEQRTNIPLPEVKRKPRNGEPSLRQRLHAIFHDLPLDFRDNSVDNFAKECADRRNDIFHFGGERKQDGRMDFILELDRKSDALTYLYHLVILREIGVDDDTIRRWVRSSFRLRYALANVGLLRKDVLGPSASNIVDA